MATKIGRKLFKLAHKFRVEDGKSFRLKDFAPDDTCGFDLNKAEADAVLSLSVSRLQDMQRDMGRPRVFAATTGRVTHVFFDASFAPFLRE